MKWYAYNFSLQVNAQSGDQSKTSVNKKKFTLFHNRDQNRQHLGNPVNSLWNPGPLRPITSKKYTKAPQTVHNTAVMKNLKGYY